MLPSSAHDGKFGPPLGFLFFLLQGSSSAMAAVWCHAALGGEAAYSRHCSRLIGSDSWTRAEKRKVPTGAWTRLAISMNPRRRPTQSDLFDRLMLMRLLNSSSSSRNSCSSRPPTPLPSSKPPEPLSIPASTCVWEEFKATGANWYTPAE